MTNATAIAAWALALETRSCCSDLASGWVGSPLIHSRQGFSANDPTFHYINTHLESFDANIRELQGGELRAGPANTPLPLIIAMDSNAQAFPLPQDPTYTDFVSAGYNDVWSEIFSKRAGLTCCQAESDNNPVSQLYQRIDLVLTHGKVTPWETELIGTNPASRLPDGLWPSDHAAVVAGVLVGSE
jgi:hypothetical protein